MKFWIEAFGYLGSALVVVSMLMTSVKKLRIVNTTGSVIFAIYALIIQSYPTALMNFCLVGINLYRLYQLSKTERHFSLMRGETGIGMIKYLLQYYAEDIHSFFPDVVPGDAPDADTAFLVTCDAVPAGLLIGHMAGEGALHVVLDYSTPTYRDCSVGTYLYDHLKEQGISRLVFHGTLTDAHTAYLKKMGFEKTEEGYTKTLE